jgi:hypothetical protein
MNGHTIERQLLSGRYLYLGDESFPWILNHIDCFVSQSRGNKDVEILVLNPHSFHGQDDGFWDKVGQGVTNLPALSRIHFVTDILRIVDWDILARILSHVRQRITLDLSRVQRCGAEHCRSFARAIHGHPTITSFEGDEKFPYESLETLYSALATLPALESLRLSNHGLHTQLEDESALANPESLTELLRIPSLRSVCFEDFHFTGALCKATANGLMESTAMTKLDFIECSFPDGVLIGTLAAALPSNSTLRELTFEVLVSDDDPVHA